MDEGKFQFTPPSFRVLTPTPHTQGGNAIWGNGTHAPDDDCDAIHSHGELIAFRGIASIVNATCSANMTAEDASNWILEHTPSSFQVSLFAPVIVLECIDRGFVHRKCLRLITLMALNATKNN